MAEHGTRKLFDIESPMAVELRRIMIRLGRRTDLDRKRALMVTSSQRGEGKSLFSLNFSLILAYHLQKRERGFEQLVDVLGADHHGYIARVRAGLVAMGELEFRMKSSKVKANQLKATGARVVATACENCHSQLSDINEYYGLGMKVEFLSHLVAKALVKAV